MTFPRKAAVRTPYPPCPSGKPHHWKIKPAKGPTSEGRCSHCKGKRTFSNTAETTFSELNERRYDRSLRRQQEVDTRVLADMRMAG